MLKLALVYHRHFLSFSISNLPLSLSLPSSFPCCLKYGVRQYADNYRDLCSWSYTAKLLKIEKLHASEALGKWMCFEGNRYNSNHLNFVPMRWATKYTVGGSSGLDLGSNIQLWLATTTFLVGDDLVFIRKPNHDVGEVNRLGYDTCSISKPLTHTTERLQSSLKRAPGTSCVADWGTVNKALNSKSQSSRRPAMEQMIIMAVAKGNDGVAAAVAAEALPLVLVVVLLHVLPLLAPNLSPPPRYIPPKSSSPLPPPTGEGENASHSPAAGPCHCSGVKYGMLDALLWYHGLMPLITLVMSSFLLILNLLSSLLW